MPGIQFYAVSVELRRLHYTLRAEGTLASFNWIRRYALVINARDLHKSASRRRRADAASMGTACRCGAVP